MKPESSLLSELVERVREVVSPVRIILFGSAARGDMGPESDIDILVIVPDGLDTRAVTRRIYRNLIGFGASSDVVVATESDIGKYGDRFGLVYYPALREGRDLYAA